MGCHCGADHESVLSDDSGSGIVEGLVAIGLAFLMMVVLVQAAMLTIARTAADAATSQAARRGALLGTPPADIASDLNEMLLATVPGAVEAESDVAITGGVVTASSEVRWSPPGPDLFDLRITASSTAVTIDAP